MPTQITNEYRTALVERLQQNPSVQRCQRLHNQLEMFPKRHSRRRYLKRKPVIEAVIDQVIHEHY